MVNSSSLNGLGNIKTMINHVQYHLHGGIDDGLATRAAHSEERLSVMRDDGWRHARERPLFRSNQVWRGANLTPQIRYPRHCIEIAELIVQQVPSTRNGDGRTIAEFQRVSQAHHIAVFVYHRKMGGFFRFINLGKQLGAAL